MKANELRIGNYYQWYAENKYYIFQVEAKDFKDDNYLNFEPIPLTEEWLLKFGFEKWVDNVYYIEINAESNLHKNKLRVFYNIGHVFIDHDKKIKSNLQYVHQLQNLYFALTQTELGLTISEQ